MKTALTILKDAGFAFTSEDFPTFGTIKAEHVDFGKDYVVCHFRDVFLAKVENEYYVTSHIICDYRRYRWRETERGMKVANIFASGKTAEEAAQKFVDNFKAKRYNTR